MKKSLFVFVLSLFCLNAKSQDILDVITKEVCSCANEKKDMLKDAASEKVQMQLGLCIISSFSSHEKEVTAKYGNVMEAEGAMEKLGVMWGLKWQVFVGCIDDVCRYGIGIRRRNRRNTGSYP